LSDVRIASSEFFLKKNEEKEKRGEMISDLSRVMSSPGTDGERKSFVFFRLLANQLF